MHNCTDISCFQCKIRYIVPYNNRLQLFVHK